MKSIVTLESHEENVHFGKKKNPGNVLFPRFKLNIMNYAGCGT